MEHPDTALQIEGEEGPGVRLTHKYQALWKTQNPPHPKWECSVSAQSW